MKDKKDFISFLEDSHLFLSQKQNPDSRALIIKNSSVDSKRIQKKYWGEVDGENAEIQLLENNGKIDTIRFRCKCGCQTTIKLEYETAEQPDLN